MDVCHSRVMSTSDDGISSCELHSDPPDSCESETKNLLVNGLVNSSSESLKVPGDQKSTRNLGTTLENNGCICLVKEDDPNNSHGANMVNFARKKCIDNCATFKCVSGAASSAGLVCVEEKREVVLTAEVPKQIVQDSPDLHSNSLTTPLKLVSAMKGSREKQGKPALKLSVTWSPDVYDPTPTAVSHVPSNKSRRHRSESKKNGKNKQKGSGKSSRGSSKSKEKKQTRKTSRSSNMYDRCLDHDPTVSSSEPLSSISNYDVGSSDQFCGSSFLMASVLKLHYSVGEAS